MKRRAFILTVLLALLPGFAMKDVNKYWGSTPDSSLGINWSPILVSAEGIIVVYEVKYGAIYTIPCIGLWEDKTQFMLTFKNGDGNRLQKSNIVSIYYKNKSSKNFTKVEFDGTDILIQKKSTDSTIKTK